jgi:hypothetical protein
MMLQKTEEVSPDQALPLNLSGTVFFPGSPKRLATQIPFNSLRFCRDVVDEESKSDPAILFFIPVVNPVNFTPGMGLINILISWPVKLNDETPLNLHARGRLKGQSDGFITVIVRKKHEFRTAASAKGAVAP